MRQHYRVLIAIMLIILAFTTISVGQAHSQQQPNSCFTTAVRALAQLGSNCAGLDGNNACYGFDDTDAMFKGDVEDDFFTAPGDRTPIITTMPPTITLATLATTPIDIDEGTWGLAVANVYANLPLSLPEHYAVYVLLGGMVEIENGVEPEDTLLLPEEPVDITVPASTNLFNAPPTFGIPIEIVGTANGVTLLEADGISGDGDWLRVYFEYDLEFSKRATAWVSRDVDPGADVSDLPVIERDSQTSMQTFYLRNEFSAPLVCAGRITPPVLFIQGPSDIDTDITVNGATIRISSGVVLRNLSPGDLLQLIVLSGFAIVDPDTEDAQIIPAGYSTTICLGEEQDLGIDGIENDREVDRERCRWTVPRGLSAAELGEFSLLENLPENLLHGRIQIPEIIRASGVGGTIPIFRLPPRTLERLRELCDAGRLPDRICDSLG